MSVEEDDIKDRVNALSKALETHLFKGKSPEDMKAEMAEKSKFALYKTTLKMLGWTESDYGNSFYKRHSDGSSEKITLPVYGGFLKMESLDAILKSVTFDMNKLVLWPKIETKDL